ncbi:MAG: chemotaxis protein CheX [Gammaproteobacteria bacterium]|nr:chemotaxis protein CheX [Gammaproteobacteria bacterium]
MINEQELSVFANASLEFFAKNTGILANIDEPQIELGDPPLKHVAGLIEISGVAHGYVYATSTRDDITKLLKAMGETDIDSFMIQDIMGELASTISSNARQSFGERFKVSVPKIIACNGRHFIKERFTSLILPVKWQGTTVDIVIGINAN